VTEGGRALLQPFLEICSQPSSIEVELLTTAPQELPADVPLPQNLWEEQW
jgi:hypothetical protein